MAATSRQPIPVLGHYSSGVVPGSSDHGLFATQKIDAGTRIICEVPLITLPAPGDHVPSLMRAFDALSVEDREKIWKLKPASGSASDLLIHMAMVIEPLMAARTETACTEEEKKDLEKRLAKLAELIECFRISSRWHNARYELISHLDPESFPLPQGTPVSGLFIETAQLRHSCVPNCYARIGPRGIMTVHTMRPIDEGEELTTNTISVYYNTAAFRASKLKATADSTCTCEACDPSHAKFKKHEKCRLANNARNIQISRFCDTVNIVQHSNLQADLCLSEQDLPHPNDPITIEDLREAETAALALIKGLKDTGCQSPELIGWQNVLIDRIQPRIAHCLQNDEERMRYWRIMLCRAVECVKISLRCFGADSEELEWARVKKERMEGLIERAQKHQEWLEECKKKVLG